MRSQEGNESTLKIILLKSITVNQHWFEKILIEKTFRDW